MEHAVRFGFDCRFYCIRGEVPPSSHSRGEPASLGATSERRLLDEARRGNRSAAGRLFEWYRTWQRRWARGRQHSLARLDAFEPTHDGALRAYLQRAVANRIRDRLRRAARRRNAMSNAP